ncbi:MAG: helix-turn-helix domain-containing protein [Burkholderiales bacterium]|nr:MAG: helix-turn-helix domain-containing protein [Burkholderiales bacterium]TAG82815.1 MAG: helix-turn-helix domain-containing protein [Betaproteobacteria bacterium]
MNDTVMGDTITDRTPNLAGGALRAAREKAGLTAEEVASKLKLSARQILAIEAEDWANLPERTFTRGFFYSYARLVHVDKSVIDQSFSRRAAALNEMRTLPEGIGEVTVENTSARSALAKWLIPAALLAALLAGIAWFVYKDVPFPKAASRLPLEPVAKALPPSAPSTDASPVTANSGTTSAQAAGTNVTSGANTPLAAGSTTSITGTQPSSPTPASAGASVPISLLASNSLTSASPAANQTNSPGAAVSNASGVAGQPAPAAAPTPVAPAARALAKGERRIVIEATGRSWSEARAGGDVVLSEMLSGNSREFIAKGPISFVIGNSSNVKLSIDGKPYDFSPHVRNEVARFRVE